MLKVPQNKIAVVPLLPIDSDVPIKANFNDFLKPLNINHKRDWFDQNFYKCLPLSIGNMQGFVFSVPFDFKIFWNGGNSIKDTKIFYDSDYPMIIKSEFGYGIFTIHFPVTLRTPFGVNLMTIQPPNFILKKITPMTSVVESDNLRFVFSLSFKINEINEEIFIRKDTPIMGILPIPRYFCDSFSLVDANKIFSEKEIYEEMNTIRVHGKNRKEQIENNLNADGLYYSGKDIFKNKFEDHQLPKTDKLRLVERENIK